MVMHYISFTASENAFKDICIAWVSILLQLMCTDMNPKQAILVLFPQSLSCSVMMDYPFYWLGQG